MAEIEVPGLEGFTPEDASEIRKTLGLLFEGFILRRARTLNAVYSEDADWVNAFGSVKKGRAAIVDYLEGLFADDNFNAGELVAPPTLAARMITTEVAVVSGHLRIRGQGLVGGGDIALRDNHSLRILQRQKDGRWLIVSEMYMDARQDQSYVNHS
jgi:uncharacterized protein (TIGR02246 family)